MSQPPGVAAQVIEKPWTRAFSRNFLMCPAPAWQLVSFLSGSLALGIGLSSSIIHCVDSLHLYFPSHRTGNSWSLRLFLQDFQHLSVPGAQEVPFMECSLCARSFTCLTSFGTHPKLVGCNKYPHFMYEETEALLFASGHKWQSWKQIQACLIPEPSIGDQCVLNHFFTWLFIQTFINIIIFFIH